MPNSSQLAPALPSLPPMAVDVADVAALIEAFASLAWPIVAVIALCMFRSDLQQLLGRVRLPPRPLN